MTTTTARANQRKAARPPTRLKIKKGQRVLYRGRAAQVLAVCSPTRVWLAIDGTADTVWASAGELSGYVRLASEDTASRKTFASSKNKEALSRAWCWVKEFQRHGVKDYLPPELRDAIAEAMGVHARTVMRHFDLYKEDDSPHQQLPDRPGPEPGSTYLPPAVNAIIALAIKEKYESEQRCDIEEVVLHARRLAHAAGLTPPSYQAVYSRIQKCDRWQAARKRHGRVRGDAKAGPAGPPATGLEALDLVQMDHAIVDVILVDPDTREEIGRPWITLAIDVATRCVLGFYLTYYAPSQTSVALALEHCCCPKDAWLEEIGCPGEWLPFGLMKVIGWDNAKCFKSQSLVNACRDAGIEAKYRRVRNPTHGAYIERYIGTFMGQVHLLKGTTFSNTKDREDYDSQKKAVMSLPELIRWAAHQINGVYHNTRHETLGKTPLEAWNAARMKSGQYDLPPVPADRRKFLCSLLPGKFRTVTREGISRFAQRYWDDALVPLIGDKRKYWIAHDPRDVSRIYLRLDEDFLDIPWYDRTRPPVALFELERAKKAAKLEHNGPYSEAKVFENLVRTREIEERAEKTTRAARRDRAKRPKDDRPMIMTTTTVVDYSQSSMILANPLG